MKLTKQQSQGVAESAAAFIKSATEDNIDSVYRSINMIPNFGKQKVKLFTNNWP